MSTLTADSLSPPAAGSPTGRPRRSLALAVVGSRLLVLAGAGLGTAFPRVSSWPLADPGRLTLRLGSVGNVLAAASVRWDALHYLAIAQFGYRTRGNVVFFPLYPLLIRALSYLTGSYVVAGVSISLVAFMAAMYLLHQLTRAELGEPAADAAVLLLAFSPVSLFFTAIYTESLFLALALGTFLLARRGRFGWACLAATAATLTHVEGVLLTAPLAIFYCEAHRAEIGRPGPRAVVRSWGALAGPVIAIAAFFAYLHSRGYGWLAPLSDEHYYARQFTGPVTGIVEGVRAGVSGMAQIISGSASNLTLRQNAFENVLYLLVLGLSLLTLAAAYTRLPKRYALFSGLCLVTCVSSPMTTGQPLTSLDRFALVLFPLWMVAAQWLRERRLLRAALAASGALLFMLSLQFARWVFFG